MRNKFVLLGLALAVSTSLAACSKTANPQASQKANTASSDHITAAGGLGDPTDYLKEKYGTNAGKQNIGSYQKGAIKTEFNDNRATSIDYSFDKTDKARRTQEEVATLIKNMIPSDAKTVNEVKNAKTGETDTVYESSTLAKVFEKNYKEASDVAAKVGGKAPKAGTFLVQVKQDQKGISEVVFGLGDI